MSDAGPPLAASEGGRSYQLDELLGRGGFGEVYRGRLTGASGFTKEVAIKVLNAEHGQVLELAQRLRDEARLLALLRHRAIVHVEDLVQIQGRWAVVMEYVSGADLGELMTLGPIPLRPVCEVAAEVAGALQAAHEATDPKSGEPLQIVHRDIKPANIRISRKGEVKVLDFGIARARFDRREAATRSIAFGSMGYLAPERMEFTDTPAADVYALGIVTCEALMGGKVGQLSVDRLKQRGQVDELVLKVRDRVGAACPVALCELLEAMLTYDMEDRPAACKVEDAFQEILLGAPAPWLKRWAPEAQARLTQSKVVPVVEVAPTVLAPANPSSGDSLQWDQAEAPPPVESRPKHVVRSISPSKPPSEPIAPPQEPVSSPQESVRPPPVVPAPPVVARPNVAVSAPLPRPDRGRTALWVGVLTGLLTIAGGLGLVVTFGPSLLHKEPAQTPNAEPPPVVVPVVAPTVPDPPLVAPVVAPPVVAPPVAEPAPPVKPASTKPATTAPTTTPKPVKNKVCAVEITGTIASASLVNGSGSHSANCDLSPGTYHLRVKFPGGNTIEPPNALTLESGQTLKIRCDDSVERCVW